MDSVTLISYTTGGNFSRRMFHFAYFGDFSLRMHSFDHIPSSGLKSDVIFEFNTPVSDFCEDNVIVSRNFRKQISCFQ